MAPRTRLQKTFASAVASSRMNEVSPQEFKDLQQQFAALQQENRHLKSRVSELENKMQYLEKDGKVELVKSILEECAVAPPVQLMNTVKDIVENTMEV